MGSSTPNPLARIGKTPGRALRRAEERRTTFRLDRFDDFHLHGASAPEWDQRYLQISPGAMRSSLAEATAGHLHVFRKWMSERVIQQGCLPAGQICFAVAQTPGAGMPWMQGRELRDDGLFVLRGGDDFTLQRPKGMELLAVTFRADEFACLLDARPWPQAARSLLTRSVLQAPAGLLRQLRHQLLAVLAPPAGASIGEAAASQALFELLRQLFAGAAGGRQAAGSASASYIVAECHRIAAGSADTPPDVDALCRRLHVSRRSLQNGFRQVADTSPLHYLRSLRLNLVRRRLMSTPTAELSVSQAATDQGFDHLSHFSARYRALFGELPSQTSRRG